MRDRKAFEEFPGEVLRVVDEFFHAHEVPSVE
jgi:hypothetical protein